MSAEELLHFYKPKLWEIPQPSTEVYEALPSKIAVLAERLESIVQTHKTVKLASSLAVEDMLITDMIARYRLAISVFTLNTGLLHKETLALWEVLIKHYPDLTTHIFMPDMVRTNAFVEEFGKTPFYESVALRRQCCFLRKIEPLSHALKDADAWITGQRREQSITRAELTFVEEDKQHQMAKYNPIFDWSEQEVWAYILTYQVPYNTLYQQGYPSIGCDPCTRPVKAGEDIRAGRWWWENQESKECGLHK
ncbi:phosphoadenylyl-sulfate reductase [Pelistega sp. NLN82]|uniref:Adenosine 5'-phosphosulfate reductase n=1 Tax=Pelistega ratti TaxID=2652177 RepID=A0A6L9Y803_9BURK|nr:phosphoadenylyl-sulfate reductase [Pelistega ratti]NEN75904.1 phosphoadenylyl-sulfate reductase [Pelistega ratti]